MDVSPGKRASILTLRENIEKTYPGDIKDCWCQYTGWAVNNAPKHIKQY